MWSGKSAAYWVSSEAMEHGRLIGSYRGSFRAGGSAWYIGAVLVLAGVVQAGKLALGLTTAKAGETAMSMDGVGVAIGGFVAGACVLLVCLNRWRQRLEVYEGAYVHRSLLGNRTVASSDIASVKLVTRHTRMSTHDRISVTLRNGRTHTIVGISEGNRVTRTLQNLGQTKTPPA